MGADGKFTSGVKNADGSFVLNDGTRVLADGTRILADGTRILADGTVVDADGNVIGFMGADGNIMPGNRVPDGYVPHTFPPQTSSSPRGKRCRSLSTCGFYSNSHQKNLPFIFISRPVTYSI